MYVTTNTDFNTTNYCDKITDNCTDIENNTEITIPTLSLTIQCGLSFLYLISLMVYTLIKPLITNE